jgi:hypothetical protein
MNLGEAHGAAAKVVVSTRYEDTCCARD